METSMAWSVLYVNGIHEEMQENILLYKIKNAWSFFLCFWKMQNTFSIKHEVILNILLLEHLVSSATSSEFWEKIMPSPLDCKQYALILSQGPLTDL